MKSFIKKYWLCIALLSVLNIIMIRYGILNHVLSSGNSGKNGLKTAAIIIGGIILNFAFLAVYNYAKKKQYSSEKIYLIVALFIGIFTVFITPIDYVPDEYRHIMRAYEISKGNFIADRNEEGKAITRMPVSVYNSVKNKKKPKGNGYNAYRAAVSNIIHETWEMKDVDYSTTAGYPPIAYLPHSLGLAVTNIFHISPVFGVYLGRLFELICVVFICYYALKIIPKYKDIFTYFLLFPMTIQQSMGVAADGVLIGCSFLFIALVLRLVYDKKSVINKKWLAILYATGIIIVVCKKIVYFPLLLILFLIPSNKFKSKRAKYIHIACIMFAAIIVTGAWMFTQETTVSTGTNGLATVLDNPVDFVIRMFGSFFGAQSIDYYDQIIGHALDYTEISAHCCVYIFGAFALMLALLIRNTESITIKKYERALYAIIPIVIVCLIYFVSETQWQIRPDSVYIPGMQGRYLTPLLPLLPFIINMKKAGSPKRIDMDYVYIFMISFNVCMLTIKIVNNTF